jgi:hypothetical protein
MEGHERVETAEIFRIRESREITCLQDANVPGGNLFLAFLDANNVKKQSKPDKVRHATTKRNIVRRRAAVVVLTTSIRALFLKKLPIKR